MMRSGVCSGAAALGMALAMCSGGGGVAKAGEFPFGLEMTLDAAAPPGSKKRPTLDIGDAGETRVELWCKGGQGQFSVAGNTVIFMPGAMEARSCTPAQAALDDALLTALSEAATWSRQGDVVVFNGARPLRYRINTN